MAIVKENLNRKEAANYLTAKGYQISAGRLATLAIDNNSGKGPPFISYGRSRLVTYKRQDLDDWLAARSRRVE